MNKNVVLAMFNDIASRDQLRPVLQGVHFEEGRCACSDTHLLVVYKETHQNYVNKTMNIRGEEIPGKFPNVDRVIPQEKEISTYSFRIDLNHLYKATGWFSRLTDAHTNDTVILEGKAFSIRDLHRLLRVFSTANELTSATMYKTEESRPTVIRSKSLTALIMPCACSDFSTVDQPRTDGESVKISYENLLNRYAFESWQVKPAVQPYAWLD